MPTTLTLTQAIFIGGVRQPEGSRITVDDSLAGALISENKAIRPADFARDNKQNAQMITDLSTGFTGLNNQLTNQVLPIQQSSGQRPRLMVFGNSIAGFSNDSLVTLTTTVPSATAAGSLTVTVAAIGSIVNGSKLAFVSYDNTTFYTTVNGAPVGNVVTLASPLPKALRAGAGVQLYTLDYPGNVRRSSGSFYQGMALMGMPVDYVQGYGYGGGTIQEMILDLPHALEDVRPQYVYLHLFENSMATAGAQLIAYTKMAIETCLNYGAIPLVNTPYPNSSYTAGAQVANYDAVTTYIVNVMPTEYPNAIPLNVGNQWVDTAQPTLRTPLAGWTDGVHPNANRYIQIGEFYRTILSPYFTARSIANRSLSTNPLLTGAGGTAGNLIGGSIVPVGFNITAQAGVTTTTSRNADGSLKVVMSVAGTSNVSTTQTTITVPTVTLGANGGSRTQASMCYFKVKVNQVTGVDFLQLNLNYGDGSASNSTNQQTSSGMVAVAEILGETLQWESPYLPVPFSPVNINGVLNIRPVTGLNNGVFVDIDIYEAGIVPMSYVSP
jgi:hypothetical protein